MATGQSTCKQSNLTVTLPNNKSTIAGAIAVYSVGAIVAVRCSRDRVRSEVQGEENGVEPQRGNRTSKGKEKYAPLV